MANFTISQKMQVRKHLGYPIVDGLQAEDTASISLNTKLDADYASEFTAIVSDILVDMEDSENNLRELAGNANITKADVVEFDYSLQYQLYKDTLSDGREQLANIFDADVRHPSSQSSSSWCYAY